MAKPMEIKKPKDTKKTIIRLGHYLGKHKLSIFIVAILVVISSGANLMGTYLLKPVINKYIVPGDVAGLLRMIVFMSMMYAAGALATYGYSRLMVHTAQEVIAQIRNDLFAHVQSLSLSYFDTHTHGELMSRFTNDVDTMTDALNNSFTMLIQSFIVVSGSIVMLVILNLQLSVIVLVCLGLMFFTIRYNGRKSKKYYQDQQKYLGNINGFIEEMVAGQKVEKIFNHEDQDFEEFCKRNEKLRMASTKAFAYSGVMVPVVVSISYFNYALSACVGGLFTLAGLMDIGSLASYLIYVRQIAMPVNQFTQQVNFILAALSGAERIFTMMDEQPEVDDGEITLCRVRIEDDALVETDKWTGHWAWKKIVQENSELTLLQGDVRFHNVVFSYDKRKVILDDISLYAKPGQKIAFVGSTGAGKTTIINLVNRFYEIDAGSITYDGIDIRRIRKEDLRKSLSMVLQDTHLFTGTIADNIRYGRLDASHEEVIGAAKLANADSFIRRLPDGYNTMLTNDGTNLSQGQRQLIAIARAAIADPPVLILDEATSSIDTRTEKLIEKGMDALMDNRTVFVIAHRLSTVRNAKAILVLENGTIIERGDHEELLEQKGRYYQLYTGQFELD
ncbi:MAG: ABC transporter ATP-binding protein [Lachnospiraceae bacterium]